MDNRDRRHILFLTADRTAGGIQRALGDWASVITGWQEVDLTLIAPPDRLSEQMMANEKIAGAALSNSQRLRFRHLPWTAPFGHPKGDIGFIHNAFLVPAGRHLARTVIGVCHNDKPEKFRAADHLICLTDDGAQKAKQAGWHQDNITCLPHFIAPATPPTRHIHNRDLHIVAAGRLVAKKNFALFIDIAAAVKAKIPSMRFSLAGTGPQEAMLRARNEAAGNPVELLGWADLTKLAAEADIFCSPSLDEPFGYVLTEMMQAGLAILATPSFGARMILDQGQAGWILPFADIGPWVDVLCQLHHDRKALLAAQKSACTRMDSPLFSRAQFSETLRALIDQYS